MMTLKKQSENTQIASELKDKTKTPITEELERLSEELDTDIRDNLPPQMLAVVVGVLKLIENIEVKKSEGK
jgi:type III secretion system FlhB-like substrate exporter